MQSTPAARETYVNRFILQEVKARNLVLYYFGLINFICAIVCIILMFIDDRQVAGINTWIKPFKFYVSIGIFCWTISWYLVYLQRKKPVRIYNAVVVITMVIEMLIITGQAARGVRSHFNVTTPMDGILFSIMGASILIFTAWTFYIFILFCLQKQFPLHDGYIWGIRAGLLLFIIFAMEGGLMASLLRHTIGAEDGGQGLPILNWSTQYGDLRIAHFFGMHALQVIPLAGYYVFTSRSAIIIFSMVYLLFVALLLWRALHGLAII